MAYYSTILLEKIGEYAHTGTPQQVCCQAAKKMKK